MKLDVVHKRADDFYEAFRNTLGIGLDTWVPLADYDEAKARAEYFKKDALASAETEEELAEIATHWLLDDMDELKYM